MIRERFQAIFDLYLIDKETYRNATPPRSLNGIPSGEILKEVLPDELREAAGLEAKYMFKGSVGLGNMADIPHLCVFDTEITKSAQEGYYIVYLFDASLTKVYLSLNQGWTRYESKFGLKEGRVRIAANTSRVQNILVPIDFSFEPIPLNTSDSLGIGYEKGNICSKMYLNGQVPPDEVLVNDLRRLVKIYQKLAELLKTRIFDVPYSRTEMEYQSLIQSAKPLKLKAGPIERDEKYRIAEREAWKRNPRIAIMALEKAGYSCENNATHETFKVRDGNHLFMEGHHLIPVQFQDDFDYSLDVPENIISLCPNCHRLIHRAKPKIQAAMIERFLKLRRSLLFERGLQLDLKKLINYYNSRLFEEDIDGE